MSTAPQPTQELRRTPLYDEHVRLGGRLVPFAGWEMPVQYRGVTDEHRAVRTAAGIFDTSHMGEIFLRGEHSAAVVDHLITNDASRLADGQALYTCACNEAGTILDDLLIYRVAQDHWLIVCNASNRDKIVAHVQSVAGDRCDVEDASDRLAMIALQGPRALEIAALLGDDGPALASLKGFHFRDATLAGVRCTVARTGYTGEDGIEMFCPSADAPALWRALLDKGAPLGVEPAGLGARDTLRLEARLSLYGNDIDETTNPLEAGLGWVVKLDKKDFIGRDALQRIKEQGLHRKLVGFEMVGRGIARHGYALLTTDGQRIGVCTSGSPGPTVGKNIGLGYVPVTSAEIGTPLLVDCRGRTIEAKIVKTPFYKRAS
ncbi:glycine cleavage system aminomethyltransferase GcvT [Chondromyces apiculatus]|uniref:Aminomethyltransferase n=1 Tax=Chondromyces apiculatus DSM 436 TaxID=1192034 RepID=A0A017SZI6_9BACT|nr:glycine cleavage system aminomethyltransferase GcvT [Chondromyces apiculatus]EYF01716.1 Aminomethyltransferase (glycine cleavage system T protein) [Chondromyces apiculatus DSM 436]